MNVGFFRTNIYMTVWQYLYIVSWDAVKAGTDKHISVRDDLTREKLYVTGQK